MSNDKPEVLGKIEYNSETRTYREVSEAEIETMAEVLWNKYGNVQGRKAEIAREEEQLLEMIGKLQADCFHKRKMKMSMEDKDYPPVDICCVCHKPFSIAPEPEKFSVDDDDDLPF